jgi:hypothetical protein
VPGSGWNFDPKYVYGLESSSEAIGTHQNISVGIMTLLSSWAGVSDPRAEPRVGDIRSWASPDNLQRQHKLYSEEKIKDSTDLSVVILSRYDEPLIDARLFNL